VIAGGVGLYFGTKIGALNLETYKVMQYEKASIAPTPAWEKPSN